jgi:hypothetical protein
LRKQPLAVLAAVAVVILPDALPAATVGLVHRLKNGDLEAWASPRVMALYRKATPKRILDRWGLQAMMVVAALVVLLGAAAGWQLLAGQGPGAGPAGDGRSAAPPPQAATAESPRGQPTKKGRVAGDVGGQSLADAVQGFNARAKSNPIGKDEPPLTEDEVVAAIRGWIREQSPATDQVYSIYQAIADQRRLPTAAALDFCTSWTGHNAHHFDVWWIDLSIRTPETPNSLGYNLRIRDRKLRCRPMTAAEEAEIKSVVEFLTYTVKFAKAADVAAALTRGAISKGSGVQVSATPAGNAVIIRAPREQAASLLKAAQALDELGK